MPALTGWFRQKPSPSPPRSGIEQETVPGWSSSPPRHTANRKKFVKPLITFRAAAGQTVIVQKSRAVLAFVPAHRYYIFRGLRRRFTLAQAAPRQTGGTIATSPKASRND